MEDAGTETVSTGIDIVMRRLRLPDLLKGLAILFMIQVHIMELFMDSAAQQTIVGKVSLFLGGPFTAMVFMIVMGYFVAASRKTAGQTIKRGAKLFFLGFLLNIGLNFHLLLKIEFAGWPYNPLEYIFGVDILYLAGLSIIILAFFKWLPAKTGKFAALFMFVLVLLLAGKMNTWLTFPERNYITPFIGGTWSWSYFPLFPWLAYPLAGYFFFLVEEKLKHGMLRYKIIRSILLVLVAAVVLYFSPKGMATTIQLPAYYHHTLAYASWALGLLIVWTAGFYLFVQKFRRNGLEKLLAWMGRNITVIYVIQWLIIGNIATAIYQTQSLKLFPVWFAGILSTTLLLSWFYEKIKFYFKAA